MNNKVVAVFLVVLVSLFVCSPVAAQGENLVLNAGFEIPDEGDNDASHWWTRAGIEGRYGVSNTGDWGYLTDGINNPYQRLYNLVSGHYYISLYVNASSIGVVVSLLYPTLPEVVNDSFEFTTSSGSGWVRYFGEVDLTEAEANYDLKIQISGVANIDDVCMSMTEGICGVEEQESEGVGGHVIDAVENLGDIDPRIPFAVSFGPLSYFGYRLFKLFRR